MVGLDNEVILKALDLTIELQVDATARNYDRAANFKVYPIIDPANR